jgi:hypothetical protein
VLRKQLRASRCRPAACDCCSRQAPGSPARPGGCSTSGARRCNRRRAPCATSQRIARAAGLQSFLLAARELLYADVENQRMMRILATLVLVCFTAFVVADGFFCQDGCRQASSPDAADRCDSSGACVLCTGGCAQPGPAFSYIVPALFAGDTDFPLLSILARALPPVYHPPRTSS